MQWFNNLKVAVKVLIACLLLMTLILVISFQGIFSVNRSAVQFEDFYKDVYGAVKDLNLVIRDILQLRVDMLSVQMSAERNNNEEIAAKLKSMEELTARYKKNWESAKAVMRSEQQKKAAAEWEDVTSATRDSRMRFLQAIKDKEMARSRAYLDEWAIGYRKIRDDLDKIIVMKEKEAEAVQAGMAADVRSVLVLSIIMLLVAIGMSAVITFVLARSVSKPVRKGLDFARNIAEGDLTGRIDMDQNDELGELAKALNVSAESLERFVSEVLVASQNLSQAVEQIASGNQNLSQRTSEQASSLEEIASTIEETTATIRQNAENSEQANKLSMETMRMAEQGNSVVVDAVASINEVNKSSKKIEEIISVINEIAFQTNLLALNAAVEAARAGEQGRGFAVVAGEVRNLAQRSGNAAKEIGALIKESMDKIVTGTDLVNRSGDAIREIVNSMKNVARLVSEIAAANQEQKQGIDQINIAVSEMDTMTQQNAALVEETASASEEMAGQAKEMQGMVERFKISDNQKDRTFSTRHKEVHLKAAEVGRKKPAKAAGNGDRKAPKPEDAAAMERRKASEAPRPVDGKGVRDTLKDEGFEEF